MCEDVMVMSETGDAYHELYAYTMGRPRPPFVLQHVVDAHAAQEATSGENSIRLVFGLVGLYLHLEKGYDGVQVQRAHQKLGKQKRKRTWPAITLPANRGTVTPETVMAVAPGPARDAAIDEWCASVWAEYRENGDTIIGLLREHQIV